MERTSKQDPEAILWKKTGGGSFHVNIGGRVMIIKQNQTFLARTEEIPLAFRDTVIPVDPAAASKVVKKREEVAKKAAPSKYFLKERGGNWWDVVSEDGKVQNEKALRKPEAEELLTLLRE